MDGQFASATAVVRHDETSWRATIEPGWDIASNANGGYLIAIAPEPWPKPPGVPIR